MSTHLDAFAHDIFPDERSLQAFSFVDRPVLAKLEQRTHTVSGRTWGYPCLLQAAIAQGTTRAAVQEQAQQASDVAGFDGEEFTLGYFPPGYKGGFMISEFDMALTGGPSGVPDGAYMENFAIKLRESGREFGQRQERYFLGRPGKSLARSTANGGTTNFGTGVVQLTDPMQIGAFRHAMILNASVNDGSGAHALLGVGSDQKIYVVGLDMDSGQLLVSSSSGGAAGHAAMNIAAGVNQVYLFNYSDFQGTSGYTPNVMPPGLQDFIPSTWSSAIASLGGVARGRDSRLAGWRLNTTNFPALAGMQLDTIIDLALERAFALFGVSGTYTVLCAPRRWTQYLQIAKNRGYRIIDGGTAQMGYKAVEIVHGNMRAELVSVPSMSADDLFFLKMDDDGWCVRSLGGGWPRVMSNDGMKMLRLNADDSYEYRTLSFFHFGVRYINMNGRIDISFLAL